MFPYVFEIAGPFHVPNFLVFNMWTHLFMIFCDDTISYTRSFKKVSYNQYKVQKQQPNDFAEIPLLFFFWKMGILILYGKFAFSTKVSAE